MASVKGTETEKNLLASFAGESQARNRYTFFAKQAKKEGYVQMALIFEETAAQEKEHAERFWSYLEGGDVEFTATFPAGFEGKFVGNTLENLKHGAAGENLEHTELYPGFADVADKEGFPEIAAQWRSIAKAEEFHEKRYLHLAKNIETDRVFKREEVVVWRCLNCSYRHEGKEAPQLCPACKHDQGYYEILCENW
jgi:rubrerythrin